MLGCPVGMCVFVHVCACAGEMDSMAKMLRDTGPANSVTEFLITNYVAILFPVGRSPSDTQCVAHV